MVLALITILLAFKQSPFWTSSIARVLFTIFLLFTFVVLRQIIKQKPKA